MRRLQRPRGGRSQYLAILVVQAWFPPGLVSLNRIQARSAIRPSVLAIMSARTRPERQANLGLLEITRIESFGEPRHRSGQEDRVHQSVCPDRSTAAQ